MPLFFLMENENAAGLKSYSEWAYFTITSWGFDLCIKNAELSWGKLYLHEDIKEAEISTDSLYNIHLRDGQSFSFGACGREHAAAGTAGSFEIWDKYSRGKVGTYTWDCGWDPLGVRGPNLSLYTPVSLDSGFVVQVVGGAKSGALGKISITAGIYEYK